METFLLAWGLKLGIFGVGCVIGFVAGAVVEHELMLGEKEKENEDARNP